MLDLGTRTTLDWVDLDHWLTEQADAYRLAQDGRTPVNLDGDQLPMHDLPVLHPTFPDAATPA